MRTVTQTRELYFPEAEGNKVYAVDCYVTVCRCLKVEAASKEKAAEEARNKVVRLALEGKSDYEMLHALSEMGFQDAEELEVKVSGEANESGEIEYY